jgi:hypothetical protein
MEQETSERQQLLEISTQCNASQVTLQAQHRVVCTLANGLLAVTAMNYTLKQYFE